MIAPEPNGVFPWMAVLDQKRAARQNTTIVIKRTISQQ